MLFWKPGDFSASGLLITIGYVVLGVACWRLEHSQWSNRRLSVAEGHRRFIWTALAASLFIVAVERQLGLFDVFTNVMRVNAEIDGSYDSRRARQADMLRIVIFAVPIIGIGLAALAGRAGARAAALTLIIAGSIAFLIVKAISLHAVDAILGHRLMGVAVGNQIECGLIALAAFIIASEHGQRRARQRQKRSRNSRTRSGRR